MSKGLGKQAVRRFSFNAKKARTRFSGHDTSMKTGDDLVLDRPMVAGVERRCLALTRRTFACSLEKMGPETMRDTPSRISAMKIIVSQVAGRRGPPPSHGGADDWDGSALPAVFSRVMTNPPSHAPRNAQPEFSRFSGYGRPWQRKFPCRPRPPIRGGRGREPMAAWQSDAVPFGAGRRNSRREDNGNREGSNVPWSTVPASGR